MILFIDNNSGVLFIKWITTGVKQYITGLIETWTSVTVHLVGFGSMSVTVNTWTDILVDLVGFGSMSVTVNTWTTAVARWGVWITEVIRKNSFITKIFKGRSNI